MRDGVDDTASWASKAQFEYWASLDSVAKMQIVAEHSVALQELSIAGLRERYPEADDEELELRAAALRLGEDEFERWTGRRFEW